jgi:hypothetical protein
VEAGESFGLTYSYEPEAGMSSCTISFRGLRT